MNRIADINIGARSRIRSLDLLIARSLIADIEGSVDSLFCYDLVLNVIFLLFVVVLAGSRNLGESLPSVRSLALVLPKLSTLSLGKEGLRLLPDELSVSVLLLVLLGCLLDREGGCVGARTWIWRLHNLILAVRHLRLEDFVLAR